jgi:very-short-patch-repair endonuclease
MTYSEVLLWQRLRSKVSGLHFRNQHPIGFYIVDFYYSPMPLVVEVDGQIHAQPGQIAHDESRDRFLIENGYRVVRISAEILKDADSAAASIASLAARPLHRPSDGPPPRAGED